MKQSFVLRDGDILKRVLSILSVLPIGEEKLFEIIIQEHKEKRTREQNAKWHTMIGEMADISGQYTPQETKCLVKKALGYYHEFTDREGETYVVYDRTSKMNVEQLSNLIEQTYEWASSKGVLLS